MHLLEVNGRASETLLKATDDIGCEPILDEHQRSGLHTSVEQAKQVFRHIVEGADSYSMHAGHAPFALMSQNNGCLRELDEAKLLQAPGVF